MKNHLCGSTAIQDFVDTNITGTLNLLEEEGDCPQIAELRRHIASR
jgi:dTDP-D-glucose 4,6-dehydratase